MAHALGNTRRARVTLNATNRQVLTLPDGAPHGEWLEIVWAATAHSASNIVHVEFAADLTDNVARGTSSVVLDVHPGGGYQKMIWTGGARVAVSGSSAFDVSLALV